MDLAVPNRSSAAGAEVVEIVTATFRGLRAERDTAVALLRRVLDADPIHDLDPQLLGEIAEAVTAA